MTEPSDDLDTWLARDVQPLPPPPGTFERISHRARRRKLSQVLVASAGAFAVIAGGVLIPAAATGLLSGNSGPAPAAPPAAAARSSSPSATTPPPARTPPASPAVSTPALTGSALSETTSGAAVPANFQPTSITMIGSHVGAVIGQAGTPGHCGPPVAADCTSLAGTSDYGQTWYGVSAPVTGGPGRGGTGVSELRFLNLLDGWAFGPAMYATATGGRTWTQEPTAGLRVTGLETAGNRAFVIMASCPGDATGFATECSVFSLYSTVAGSTQLSPVQLDFPAGTPAGAMGTPGQPSSAMLAIAADGSDPEAGTGYLLAPSGDVLSGSVGGGAWHYAGKAPCAPGSASPGSGAPEGAQLAVGAGGSLLLNCAGTGLYRSAGGAVWTQVSKPPSGGGVPTSLAGTSAGPVLLATTAGMLYAASPGGPWTSSDVTGGAPPGGFSYVGMTSPSQGVALPSDATLGEVYTSADGGRTWAPHKVSG